MKNITLLGVLLCGVVLLSACSSDTNGTMSCPSGTSTSQTDCTIPVVCSGTMHDCKNGAADGCETDVSGDVKNCGACAKKCPLPPHGDAVCQNNTCGVTNCEGSYQDCNTRAIDGCEIDTARDPNNCGTCGNKCVGGPNSQAACVAGKCVLACNAPYLDCNMDPSDGCEINGNNDLKNCGTCKNLCPTPTNGNAACAAGTCIVSACNAPYLTCQKGPIDGCETNTADDVNNCSACKNSCPAVANGTPACLSSACGIGNCNAPYKDCDGMAGNGCEDDTSSDVNNCASCSNACPAIANGTAACKSSQCGIGSCNTPYMDCDGISANGCEIDTSSDVNNCGTCGHTCDAGQICFSGSCVYQYLPDGPQQNVPVTTVTTDGWTQCYLDTYSVDIPVASIITTCSKAKLMLACRPTGSDTLQLLAWAPREDVLFDTGTSNTPHIANDTEWYFSATYSWGFAAMGEDLSRGQCDTGAGADRLCWHTGLNVGGYRCGDMESLNSSTDYEKLVYQAD